MFGKFQGCLTQITCTFLVQRVQNISYANRRMREKMEKPNKNFSLSNSQQSTQMILGKSGNHKRKLKEY